MTYTKHSTQQNNSRKIVVQGKKGWATYPKQLRSPVPQEKLFEEYWK